MTEAEIKPVRKWHKATPAIWKNTSMNSEPKQTPSGEAGFIDEKQLLTKLPISRRTLFNWRASGKIPCVRLGGRRILFHWPSVEAAILRYQNPPM
jgi:predicted DNA-binding transcriptional regulator AlpA